VDEVPAAKGWGGPSNSNSIASSDSLSKKEPQSEGYIDVCGSSCQLPSDSPSQPSLAPRGNEEFGISVPPPALPRPRPRLAAKIEKAISFVKEAQVLEDEAGASSSSKTLEESAEKYKLAVIFLKNYVRGLVQQDSNGSSDSKTSATTNFLLGKIEEYETKANELLACAKEWKLVEEHIKAMDHISSKVFVPWFGEEARAYNYSPPEPCIDPDGDLKLYEKQKETFFMWKRPSEMSSNEIDLSELDGDPLPVHSLVGDTAGKYQLQLTENVRGHQQDGEIERFNVLSPKPLTIPKHSHQDATTQTNIAQQGTSNTSTTHPITSSPTTTQPDAAKPTQNHSTISTHGKTPHPVVGIAPPFFVDIWVDPVSGNDANGGATRDQALRTLSKAWRHVLLNDQGIRINLVEGDYPEATVPIMWEDRTGTFTTPVIIRAADGVGTARLPAMNVARCNHFHLDGLTISAAGRAILHFEASSDIRLRNVTVRSTAAVATNGVTVLTSQTGQPVQETVKMNQCHEVCIEDCEFFGYVINCEFSGTFKWPCAVNRVLGVSLEPPQSICAPIFGSSEETISPGSWERANKTKKKTPGKNRTMELDLSRDIKPSRDDVFCCRGGNYNIHHGNIRFTEKALELLPKYVLFSKLDKELLSVELMESVTSAGHHFLGKYTDGKWYKLVEKSARRKASQKFRDLEKNEKGSRIFTNFRESVAASQNTPERRVIQTPASSSSDNDSEQTATETETDESGSASLLPLAMEGVDIDHYNETSEDGGRNQMSIFTSTESQPNLHHPAREIDVMEQNLDGQYNDSEGIDFSGESSQLWDVDSGSMTSQLSGIWEEIIFLLGITSTESQPNIPHPAGEIDVTEPNLDDLLNDSEGIDLSDESSQLWDVDSGSMTSQLSGIDLEGWEESIVFKGITSTESQSNIPHPAGEIGVTEPNLDGRYNDSDESSQLWDADSGSMTSQLSVIDLSEGWQESIFFKEITSSESQPNLHHPAREIDVLEPNL
jgi:hypothetical protein